MNYDDPNVRRAIDEYEQLIPPKEDVWALAKAGLLERGQGAGSVSLMVLGVLQDLERAMLVSAALVLDEAVVEEYEASYRTSMHKRIMELFRDRDLFLLACKIGESGIPHPGGILSTQLPSIVISELIAAYSQLCVVLNRQRRLLGRIADLEAEVAALRADAGGEPPIVKLG